MPVKGGGQQRTKRDKIYLRKQKYRRVSRWMSDPAYKSAASTLGTPIESYFQQKQYTLIDDLASGSGVYIGNMDVYDVVNNVVLAQSELYGSDFSSEGVYEVFTLDIVLEAGMNVKSNETCWEKWNLDLDIV